MAALNFLSVIFAGLLAGSEFTIHYGLRAPAESLDERSQLVLRQAMVRRLRILVPAFFVPAAVFGVAVSVLGGSPGFWFRCTAMVALLGWVLIRAIGTIPINSATLDWQIETPPKNWKALVDRAERFHDAGVFAAVVAFAALVVANLPR